MAWVDPPAWKEKLFLEREERGEMDPKAAWATLEALGKREDRPAKETPEADPDCQFGLPLIPEEMKE